MLKSDWLLPILKTLHLVRLRRSTIALQWCKASRDLGPRLSDHAITDNHTSITVYQRIKSTHPDDWVQLNNEISAVKCKCYDKVPNPRIPRPFTAKISLVSVFSDKCESMWSTYGSVASLKESGEHRSAQKHGDRTEEKKGITAMLVEWLNKHYWTNSWNKTWKKFRLYGIWTYDLCDTGAGSTN